LVCDPIFSSINFFQMKKFLMSAAIFAFFGIGSAMAQGCPHAAKAAEANKPACTQNAAANAEAPAKTGCQKEAGKGCCANKAGASATATANEGTAKTCAQKAACCANKAAAAASTNPNNAPVAKPATVKAVKAQAAPTAAPKVANE
jgi:hypothetical protein